MKTLTLADLGSSYDGSERICSLYRQASAEQRREGAQWYRRARRDTKDVCAHYGWTKPGQFSQAVAALACLSPGNKWERNQQDLDRLIGASSGIVHGPFNDGHFGTYGSCVNRAWSALKSTIWNRRNTKGVSVTMNPLESSLLEGDKTYAFANLVFNPTSNRHVCIDRHATRAFLGRWEGNDRGAVRLTPNMYRVVADGFRMAASSTGVRPCEMQAVCWVVIKETYGKRGGK